MIELGLMKREECIYIYRREITGEEKSAFKDGFRRELRSSPLALHAQCILKICFIFLDDGFFGNITPSM